MDLVKLAVLQRPRAHHTLSALRDVANGVHINRVQIRILGIRDVPLQPDHAGQSADDLSRRRLLEPAVAVRSGVHAHHEPGRRSVDRLRCQRVKDLNPGVINCCITGPAERVALVRDHVGGRGPLRRIHDRETVCTIRAVVHQSPGHGAGRAPRDAGNGNQPDVVRLVERVKPGLSTRRSDIVIIRERGGLGAAREQVTLGIGVGRPEIQSSAKGRTGVSHLNRIFVVLGVDPSDEIVLQRQRRNPELSQRTLDDAPLAEDGQPEGLQGHRRVRHGEVARESHGGRELNRTVPDALNDPPRRRQGRCVLEEQRVTRGHLGDGCSRELDLRHAAGGSQNGNPANTSILVGNQDLERVPLWPLTHVLHEESILRGTRRALMQNQIKSSDLGDARAAVELHAPASAGRVGLPSHLSRCDGRGRGTRPQAGRLEDRGKLRRGHLIHINDVIRAGVHERCRSRGTTQLCLGCATVGRDRRSRARAALVSSKINIQTVDRGRNTTNRGKCCGVVSLGATHGRQIDGGSNRNTHHRALNRHGISASAGSVRATRQRQLCGRGVHSRRGRSAAVHSASERVPVHQLNRERIRGGRERAIPGRPVRRQLQASLDVRAATATQNTNDIKSRTAVLEEGVHTLRHERIGGVATKNTLELREGSDPYTLVGPAAKGAANKSTNARRHASDLGIPGREFAGDDSRGSEVLSHVVSPLDNHRKNYFYCDLNLFICFFKCEDLL